MKKLLSVLFLLSFTLASVYAQNIQVKGTVVSGSDNEPLPGVNVVVKGTTNGGITDLDGNFTLSVPADATLSITYIGFKSQEVAVNGKNSLKIVLRGRFRNAGRSSSGGVWCSEKKCGNSIYCQS